MRPLILLSLASCAAPDEAIVAMTEGGSYQVTLAEHPQDPGLQRLRLQVDPGEGALEQAYLSMPSMGHGHEASIFAVDSGLYEVEVDLEMPGWWVLDGVVSGEDFRLEFELP